MSVKAPAEKNFRRARVKPAKRKSMRPRASWRLARRLVATIFVAYAGYRAVAVVLGASGLEVRHITVHGNARLSAGEVQTLVDGLRGTNILTADLGAYRRRLLDSPWVADVAIRRVLPSSVELFVSERTPIGLYRSGEKLYLIDRLGVTIDEFGPQYSEFDLPIIDGLVGAPSHGASIDPVRAELAARVIDAVAPRQDLARRLSQVDVSDPHDAVVLLDQDVTLLHVGEDQFLERLQGYVDFAPTLRDHVHDIEYVDLRFEKMLFVGPGARRASNGPPPEAKTDAKN